MHVLPPSNVCGECATFQGTIQEWSSGDGRHPHLVKVSDDLIQEAQTLHAHVVAIQLDVEVVKVGDGGEHDAHLRVGLVVQVLEAKVRSAACQAARQVREGAAGKDRGLPSYPGQREEQDALEAMYGQRRPA